MFARKYYALCHLSTKPHARHVQNVYVTCSGVILLSGSSEWICSTPKSFQHVALNSELLLSSAVPIHSALFGSKFAQKP